MLKLVLFFALFSFSIGEYYVSTFAGSGNNVYTDGNGVLASFSGPRGVAADKFGNLFVADYVAGLIRKINSTGYVSTFAGNGEESYADGQSVNASFSLPSDVAVDLFGNIFVADTANHMIRMINATGYVSTLAGNGSYSFADGQGMSAIFHSPTGVAIDPFGNIIVASYFQERIRRVNKTGYVSTLAGNGTIGFMDGQDALFSGPHGVAIDSLGNIFVTDTQNNRIRKINSTGYVSTFNGNGTYGFSDGQGIEATFFEPVGITIDVNRTLYVSDPYNNVIRKINSTGYAITIAGNGISGYTDGLASQAKFYEPQGVAVDLIGNIFVADYLNYRIRKINQEQTSPTFANTATSSYFSAVISSSASEQSYSIFTRVSPTYTFSNFAPINSANETTILSITSSTVTATFKSKPNLPILAMYLKPEFTYSALIAMFLVGSIAICIFIVKKKTKPKVMGRREKFILNMEIQRKLELRQRQQSLPRNPFQKQNRK